MRNPLAPNGVRGPACSPYNASRRPNPWRSAARYTATTAASGSGGADTDGFRLTAEHQRDVAVRVELHDLVGTLVDRPHVVLRVDAQPERRIEPVDVLAQFADELAGGVVLEQARAVVEERAVVAERCIGMPGARVDVHAALRVLPNAADFTDDVRLVPLEEVDAVERDLRSRRSTRLREERAAEREHACCYETLDCTIHARLLVRAARL